MDTSFVSMIVCGLLLATAACTASVGGEGAVEDRGPSAIDDASPPADPAADAGASDDLTAPQRAGSLEQPAPASCALGPDSPLVLLYASVRGDNNLEFLGDDCAAEVVVGEKRDEGPRSAMASPEAQARGGRTGYVLDLNGRRIIEALSRTNAVERTATELLAKLDAGYDYIVIDEITAAAEWRDGSTVNRRFRSLLEVLPPRTVIAYISYDLTMASGGDARMRERRQLLSALQHHGRALALEVYLHTWEVRAGDAPPSYRRAASRLRGAVLGLPNGGHINERAISVLGMSIHGPYAQYATSIGPRTTCGPFASRRA